MVSAVAWSLHPLYGLSMELTVSGLWSQHGAYIRSMEYGLSMELSVSTLWSQHGACIRSVVTVWNLYPLYGLSMEHTVFALRSQRGAYSHSV